MADDEKPIFKRVEGIVLIAIIVLTLVTAAWLYYSYSRA